MNHPRIGRMLDSLRGRTSAFTRPPRLSRVLRSSAHDEFENPRRPRSEVDRVADLRVTRRVPFCATRRTWGSHRTLRFSHNPFAINDLREQRNFRSPFRSQLRVGLNHTLQDCLRRLPTIGGRGTTQRDGGSARWRVRRSPVGRVSPCWSSLPFPAAPRRARSARSWPPSSARRRPP